MSLDITTLALAKSYTDQQISVMPTIGEAMTGTDTVNFYKSLFGTSMECSIGVSTKRDAYIYVHGNTALGNATMTIQHVWGTIGADITNCPLDTWIKIPNLSAATNGPLNSIKLLFHPYYMGNLTITVRYTPDYKDFELIEKITLTEKTYMIERTNLNLKSALVYITGKTVSDGDYIYITPNGNASSGSTHGATLAFSNTQTEQSFWLYQKINGINISMYCLPQPSTGIQSGYYTNVPTLDSMISTSNLTNLKIYASLGIAADSVISIYGVRA